jgi:hypothetical protein
VAAAPLARIVVGFRCIRREREWYIRQRQGGYLIKGNTQSMLYHVPGGRSYDVTIAEVWFRTEDDARAAGFSPPDNA